MLDWLLNLLLPLYCARCGRAGSPLCKECMAESLREIESCCMVCGNYCIGWGCPECGADDKFAFGFYDQPIGELAVRLKLESARHLARPLAKLLADGLPEVEGGHVAIVPVPTAHSRVRERGLDHTRLVAMELGRIRDWEVSGYLKRQNDDLQRGKSKVERIKQSKNAFATGASAASIMMPDTIILYDDISTTGATLEECARLLRENGAKNVKQVVLAKTR